MVKLTKIISEHSCKFKHVSEWLEFDVFAWQSGFYKKRPKKITVTNFIGSFWEMQQLGKNSLRNWAAQIGVNSNKTITKQAVDERLTADAVVMVKGILRKALNETESSTKYRDKWLSQKRKELQPVLSFFNNIIIHDSTTQQLNSELASFFPGSFSQGKSTAILRIQAAYNFSQNQWLEMTVGAYTDNDQGEAGRLVSSLEKRDLLIRDLGYFVLSAIAKLVEDQYIITRWDNKTHLLELNGNKIELLAFLKNNFRKNKKNQKQNIPVLVGKDKQIPMRMVARKLPKKQAEKRIAEAKKNRHSKANHSEEYYELLRYEIYLTNVPSTILDAEQIAKMYGLRWYIEIIFKAWKSYYNFKKMFKNKKMNYHRTAITVYLLLIQFVYLTNKIYNYIKSKVEKATQGLFISILKFMDMVNNFFQKIISIQQLEQLDELVPQFSKHSTYEIRNDRKNMKDKFQYFNELLI